VVPGNSLRVVHIDSTDTEACCGTHCDNTSEVGLIRILKTGRISDGILRLYYVAGKRALEKISEEAEILHELCDSWAVQQSELVSTASRFFDGYAAVVLFKVWSL
jgi:alanyl-tRNA synthetase